MPRVASTACSTILSANVTQARVLSVGVIAELSLDTTCYFSGPSSVLNVSPLVHFFSLYVRLGLSRILV